MKRIPSLPPLPADTPRNLRPLLSAMRNAGEVRFGLGKNNLDRSPTVRELQAAGLLSVRGRTISTNNQTILDIVENAGDDNGETAVDYVPPDNPTGVTATVSRQGVLLAWDTLLGAAKINTSHAEIWRAGPIDTEDFDSYPVLTVSASGADVTLAWVNPAETEDLPPFGLVGISNGSAYSDALPHSEYFVYFIRFVSHNDIYSTFHDPNGIKVASSVDPVAVLRLLEDQITLAQMNSVLTGSIPAEGAFDDLRGEFDTHEIIQNIRELGDLAKFDAEVVQTTARVETEETIRISQDAALAARATALEASIDDASTGLLVRATALEEFRTYVEDQGEDGYLANASLFQGVESSVNDEATGLLARATVLENFKASVSDQGPTGFLATSTYLQGIEAQVGQNAANLQTAAEVTASIDGKLSGRYFNKLDLDGRITGLEFFDDNGNLTPQSNFIIRADTFQIMTTTSGNVPLSVNGDAVSLDVDVINLNGLIPAANIGSITADKITATGSGSNFLDLILQQGTIENADIGNSIQSTSLNLGAGQGWKIDKNGNIDAAAINIRNSSGTTVFTSSGMSGTHITDATVDTLKIGTNAVIVPAAVAGDSNVSLGTSWTVVASVSVNLGTGSYAPGSVFAQAFGNAQALGSGDESIAMRVRSSNGETGGDIGISAASGFSVGLATAHRFTGQSGFTTFYTEMRKSGSASYNGRGSGIFIQGTRR